MPLLHDTGDHAVKIEVVACKRAAVVQINAHLDAM